MRCDTHRALFFQTEFFTFFKLSISYFKSTIDVRARKKFEALKAVEREIAEQNNSTGRTATNGGCHNGVNCQAIVSEEELPSLLAEGWRVSAVLPSGKLIVER